MNTPPILDHKHHDRPSVFEPTSLLREARRQKSIPTGSVPDICVLDPDGDLSRHLQQSGAQRNPYWACYHTELYELDVDGTIVGVLGCAVGASFAVLVAEELFASGCRLLISVTSAGQILPAGPPPYFVLVDRALRDEGTSYHYRPRASYARIGAEALALAQCALRDSATVVQGGVWTTDAPFRETAEAIAFARSETLLAVEMEAAALYALAEAKGYPIICFAHVTNQMGVVENDFEKGESDGNAALVRLVSAIVQTYRAQP
ncbi:MAG: nucleoside phosphorylase [Kiritimatiellae bacterium]|jgi:uridine phosphorylase|nr:nucleoside phosphorylase [Kiritimatiellia bacterium]MDY0148464.1 nucleoside phosphorylase [Kiritimatiellia bacterium]